MGDRQENGEFFTRRCIKCGAGAMRVEAQAAPIAALPYRCAECGHARELPDPSSIGRSMTMTLVGCAFLGGLWWYARDKNQLLDIALLPVVLLLLAFVAWKWIGYLRYPVTGPAADIRAARSALLWSAGAPLALAAAVLAVATLFGYLAS